MSSFDYAFIYVGLYFWLWTVPKWFRLSRKYCIFWILVFSIFTLLYALMPLGTPSQSYPYADIGDGIGRIKAGLCGPTEKL